MSQINKIQRNFKFDIKNDHNKKIKIKIKTMHQFTENRSYKNIVNNIPTK